MSEDAQYHLESGLYVTPTPAGAFLCVSSQGDMPSRHFLRALFQIKDMPELTMSRIQEWTGLTNESDALALLHRMQSLGWLNGEPQAKQVPDGSLEDVLPDLLAGLSDSGKVLLADEQGFYLSSQGFPHETAEELSALSADLFMLYQRHEGLLKHNLGLDSGAWAMVDATGHGQVGFWPLWIGKHRFVLVIKGVPLLNQPAFMTLIWVLSLRYGG